MKNNILKYNNNLLDNKKIQFKSQTKLFQKLSLLAILLMVFIIPSAAASLQLDNIQFDPAIIASGDNVDVVIQYHDDTSPYTDEKTGEKEYTFKVTLEPDDDLTQNYINIVDGTGDDVSGRIFAGNYYNKVFRVKVNQNAPAGNYQFKLSGRWYHNNEPMDFYRSEKIIMQVKKEGIILDISTIDTVPVDVRPGDNFVKLTTRVENVGEKDAKSVEINLNLPEGIDASYSNNNRVWAGRVNAGESKEINFYLDLDEDLESKVYDLGYKLSYLDIDNNKYEKRSNVPFLIKSRPYIEVIESTGGGLARETGKLYVKVKNTGTESAESVDVRILKQNTQPFVIDVRSDYIGELEPGEEGVAVFDIKINPDAEIKPYDLKLLIRSKGDSDEGDDNIYTYSRRAKFEVTGQAENKLITYGLFGALAVVVFLILNQIYKRIMGSKKKGTKKEN